MISTDFYPSTATYCDGAVLCTNNITNIVVEENIEDIAKPYYIGYVKYDDMPKMCVPMFNRVDNVADDKIITFYQKPENHSWGFVRSNYSGTDSNRVKNMYYRTSLDSNSYSAQYTGENSLHKFLNKIEMCNHATSDKFTLGFHAFVVPIADISEDGTTQFKVEQSDGTYKLKTFTQTYDSNLGSNVVNVSILRDLINNNIPVMTGGTNIGGENLPFGEFYYSDFNEFGMAYKDTTNGIYRVFLWIDYIGIPGWGDYYDGNRHYGGSIEPFFEFTLEEVSGIYPEQTALYTPGQWTSRDFRINITKNVLRLTSTGMLNGYVTPVYVPYSISQNDLLNANIYWQRNGVVKNSYVLINAGGSGSDFSHYFYPHYDLKDIYKYLMFYHKIDTQGTTYQNITASDTYTTRYSTALFDSNDTPLYERVTEDYQTIVGKLRPWQMPNVDITVNEYDPADKPEYEPSGDKDEESGTRIPNQFRYFTGANNFISQYAMKASQIQTFGQMLWNSWADGTTFVDAVNNFWIALNIEEFTGSFDISSVMNFIVSLKVFPFNITHFDINTFISTDTLRIGRGTFPFLFPSEVGDIIKVLSTVIFIDCGKIHDGNGHYGVPRVFNDFRDYTNISISCFCPYCGTVELNPGDVIGRELSCKYAVDLQTGDCLCFITVEDSGGELYNVATISGNMGANIPVSATNSGLIMSRRISDIANGVGLFGGMFTENVSAGASLFANPYKQQSAIGAIANASYNALGNVFKDVQQTGQFATNMLSRGAIGCPVMQGGEGFTSFSQADTPYIQMRYGIYAEPANYPHSVGRISTSSGTIGNYKGSGFITCENVDTTKLTCHNDEKAAIAAALETGVFV